MDEVFQAIILHLQELAASLPHRRISPGRSGKFAINWWGWRKPAHRPEALSEYVKLQFSQHGDNVQCKLRAQIHANLEFPAVGPEAEVDYGLDGLDDLVKEANAIAQWMGTKDKK